MTTVMTPLTQHGVSVMALRLFLVGLVAGLGVTFPTGRKLESWKDSAQCWVNARLADWDAGQGLDDSDFVLIAEPTVSASSSIPDVTPIETTRAFSEPVPSVSNAIPVQSAELVDGLDLPTIPAAFDGDDAGPVRADRVVDSDAVFVSVLDLVLSEFAAECLAAKTAEPNLSTELDARFDLAQTATLETFATDDAVVNRVRKDTREFTQLDPADDLADDPAYALNHATDGLTMPTVVVDCRAAAFEPIEVDESLDKDTAYALNRDSDGLGVLAPLQIAVEPVRPVRQNSRLHQAVRLTREAVYAWANLLHGPAVVTLAH
jgi:hypothetical protein